jgi:hypothetical protein
MESQRTESGPPREFGFTPLFIGVGKTEELENLDLREFISDLKCPGSLQTDEWNSQKKLRWKAAFVPTDANNRK